jgi:hypothetical protein
MFQIILDKENEVDSQARNHNGGRNGLGMARKQSRESVGSIAEG